MLRSVRSYIASRLRRQAPHPLPAATGRRAGALVRPVLSALPPDHIEALCRAVPGAGADPTPPDALLVAELVRWGYLAECADGELHATAKGEAVIEQGRSSAHG